MLGEKVGSIKCTTTIKPLSAENGRPVFEVSAPGAGKLLDSDVQTMATYFAKVLADGSLYGEVPEAGVVMAGDGMGTFRAVTVSYQDFKYELPTPSIKKVRSI